MGHAETATPQPAHEQDAAPWATLGLRQVVELSMPGVAIGVLSGVIVGVLIAGVGEPFHVALFAAVMLGVPLALAGAGYELLVAPGRIPLGMLTPVALYWAVAFTLARVFQTALLD